MLRRLASRSTHWRTRLTGLPAGRKSFLNGMPLASSFRSLTTENFFSFNPTKLWHTKELSDEDTKAILAKYIAREDGRTDSVATTLSPDVIASMVEQVTQNGSKIDYKTVDVLVEQAILSGRSSTGILETLIRFYMNSNNNVAAAANVLCKCNPATFVISEALCKELINGLVENCNWNQAFKTAMYMLYLDYDFPVQAIFYIVGGLSSTTEGVIRILELIEVITMKKRTDLSVAFSYNKINNFSISMTGAGKAMRSKEALPQHTMESAMTVSLAQLKQSGWFAFPLAKMLVALACAAGHDQLAASFVRDMFQGFIDRGQGVVHSASSSTQARFQNPARTFDATATTTTAASAAAAESAFHNIDLTNTSRNNDSSSSGDVDIYNNIGSSSSSSSGGGDNFSGAIDGDVDGFTSNGDCNSADLLQLHRSFSQGDGIAERRAFFNKHFTAYSPVTVELLHMCWHPGFAPKVFEQGPMRCMNLLSNYWVLAYRCRDLSIDLPEFSKTLPFDALEAVHEPLHELHAALMRFNNDRNERRATFSPMAGFERRNFRIMCDAFGLEHKLVPVPDEPLLMDVEVWKHYAAYNMEILPPHLPQLLRKDAKIDPTGRMFDGLPLFWAEASAELRAMDDEKLSIVAQRLLNAMVNYPSPSWALLVVELLRERKIPLPLGMMRSIMKMCKKRDDLYSLLEVLHTAHVELELAKTVTYKRKLFQLRNHSKYAADVSIESITEELDDASFEVEDPTGERSVADSLNSVDWNNACVLAFRSKHANLPGNSYQEIYTEILQLMRKCQMDLESQSIKTLLRFLLYTSYHAEHCWKLIKRVKKDGNVDVSHMELVAMSYAINRKIPDSCKFLAVNKASHASPNYLHVFPNTLHMISEFVSHAAMRGNLGPDFSTSFEISWSRMHTPEGRRDLHDLVTELLATNTKEKSAIVLNENSQGRDAIALIGLLSAYLLGCYDGEYRLAFSVLSSVYQMYRESERYLTQQKALVKMRAKEEEQRGRGGFSRNRRDEDSDSDVDADDDSYSSSRRKGRKRSSTKRRADSDMY